MKTEEIRIGNWVNVSKRYNTKVYGIGEGEDAYIYDYPQSESHDIEDVDPIPLTPELLLKNGWRKQTELTYYKKLDKIRLGWQEGGVLIVGWTEWPKKIESVHQLQNILADLGYEEQANNFKI